MDFIDLIVDYKAKIDVVRHQTLAAGRTQHDVDLVDGEKP